MNEREEILRRKKEEKFFETAAREAESGEVRPGLWAKAGTMEGDQRKNYIGLRVQSLYDEEALSSKHTIKPLAQRTSDSSDEAWRKMRDDIQKAPRSPASNETHERIRPHSESKIVKVTTQETLSEEKEKKDGKIIDIIAGFIVLMLLGSSFAYLVIGVLGIKHDFGFWWSACAVISAVFFRFLLPITIGVFFYALHVWGWHWFFAALLAAPGLIIAVPAGLAVFISIIKGESK